MRAAISPSVTAVLTLWAIIDALYGFSGVDAEKRTSSLPWNAVLLSIESTMTKIPPNAFHFVEKKT